MTRLVTTFALAFIAGTGLGFLAAQGLGVSAYVVARHCEESRRLVDECNTTLDSAERAINACIDATKPDASRHGRLLPAARR